MWIDQVGKCYGQNILKTLLFMLKKNKKASKQNAFVYATDFLSQNSIGA